MWSAIFSITPPGLFVTFPGQSVFEINFELGVSGPMQFHQDPVYANMSSYIQYESGMLANASNFNQPPAELTKSVRVPVQKKNDKYTMQIQVPDPFSIALLSASWDGNYSTKRHVRR